MRRFCDSIKIKHHSGVMPLAASCLAPQPISPSPEKTGGGRGRLFVVERAGGRRAAEGVCEASKRSGRADDWQDLKGGRDEVR